MKFQFTIIVAAVISCFLGEPQMERLKVKTYFFQIESLNTSLAKYRDREGKFPAALSDVPSPAAAFIDPWGKALVYRANDRGFTVESVGYASVRKLERWRVAGYVLTVACILLLIYAIQRSWKRTGEILWLSAHVLAGAVAIFARTGIFDGDNTTLGFLLLASAGAACVASVFPVKTNPGAAIATLASCLLLAGSALRLAA